MTHQVISEVIQFCKRQKVFAILSCPWHQGLLHAAIRPPSDRVRACVWRPSPMGATLREEGPSQAETPGTGSYSYWHRLMALYNRYFYVFYFRSVALHNCCSNRLLTLAETGWLL